MTTDTNRATTTINTEPAATTTSANCTTTTLIKKNVLTHCIDGRRTHSGYQREESLVLVSLLLLQSVATNTNTNRATTNTSANRETTTISTDDTAMTTDTNRATPTNNTEPVATTKEEQIVQQQLAQATSMQRRKLARNVQRLLWALIAQRQTSMNTHTQHRRNIDEYSHSASTEEEHAVGIKREGSLVLESLLLLKSVAINTSTNRATTMCNEEEKAQNMQR